MAHFSALEEKSSQLWTQFQHCQGSLHEDVLYTRYVYVYVCVHTVCVHMCVCVNAHGPCALICCSVLFVVLFPAVVTVLSSTVMRKKVQKNLVDQDKIVKRFGACDC